MNKKIKCKICNKYFIKRTYNNLTCSKKCSHLYQLKIKNLYHVKNKEIEKIQKKVYYNKNKNVILKKIKEKRLSNKC